jgi:hypothetical protein
MAKRKRTYNVRLVKASWPYSVQEVAGLFGVHKNAVLRWLREGLRANRDKRPFLIRGDELIRFLTERRRGRKRKCSIAEFFCFRCRAPREARRRMVAIAPMSLTLVRVNAHCAVCGTPVNKVQGIRNLNKIQDNFEVQQLAERHLIESADASVNSDLEPIK